MCHSLECNGIFVTILTNWGDGAILPGMDVPRFELVTLRSGGKSIRSRDHGETMHIGTDPATEASELHIRQQRIFDRAPAWEGRNPFCIWDVGLGPAANALASVTALRASGAKGEIHSFEIDTAVLEFALRHAGELGYLSGCEVVVDRLLTRGEAEPAPGIRWVLHRGDFSLMAPDAPPPAAVLFDPYSPARNPEMWNLKTFGRLMSFTREEVPCLLTNYTRSTSMRVTMLLAGWFVGKGAPTGEKEETTVASNRMDLLENPLGADWLRRVRSSTNAAPLRGRLYRQDPISPEDYDFLEAHPQFRPS
jgi:S-adenosyl-L-methionine-dependent methyltransferase